MFEAVTAEKEEEEAQSDSELEGFVFSNSQQQKLSHEISSCPK